jgi:S1-C subfamily serine protease
VVQKILGLILILTIGFCSPLLALNKETVERVKQAVVFIMMESNNNSSINNPNGRGTCSGFVINDKGYIVTNYHCVHRTNRLKLAFYDKDDWNIYEVKIIGTDPLADVAVIHIPGRKKPLPYLKWSEEEPWAGMDVFAVGHPFGMAWTVARGIVSSEKRTVRSPYVRYIQTDTSINTGNSGGPLVNTAGNVVGINSLIISPQPQPKVDAGVALALRNDDAKEIVDTLVKGEEFVRAIVGVILADLTPLNREDIQGLEDVKKSGVTIPNTFGAIVAPGKDIPEELEVFDTIVGIDGEAVNRQDDITDVIRTKQPGDTVELLVIRDRVYKNVKVTLKKLEVTGNQLFDKQGQPTIPQPPKEEPKDETPKEEKPNEEPKTDAVR